MHMNDPVHDPTETTRRILSAAVNSVSDSTLEAAVGKTYTTAEMTDAFTVHGFLAPFVAVTRKSDGVKGTLMFRHSPRVYFDFTPDR